MADSASESSGSNCHACGQRFSWFALGFGLSQPLSWRCGKCGARNQLAAPRQVWLQFVDGFAGATLGIGLAALGFRIAMTATRGMLSDDVIQVAALIGVGLLALGGALGYATMIVWGFRRGRYQFIALPSDGPMTPNRRAYVINTAIGSFGLLAGTIVISVGALLIAVDNPILTSIARAFASSPNMTVDSSLAKTSPLPEYGWFMNAQGQRQTWGSLRGKVVFAQMWATWCGPCVMEMPSVNRLYLSLQNDPDIAWVLISEEDAATVRAFAQQANLSVPLATISPDQRPSAFATPGIPATFIIAPDGRLIFRQIGAADWDTDAVRGFLTSAKQNAKR